MIAYILSSPQTYLQRPQLVHIASTDEFKENLRVWGKAFLQGDPYSRHNPVSRPVDLALIPLFLTGIGTLIWAVRQRWHTLWIAGLIIVSLLPSLLTQHAPHFLRAIGLVIPVALIIGAGAWGLEKLARQFKLGRVASLIPLTAFALTAQATLVNSIRWLHYPALYNTMEQHINQAINFIRDKLPPDTPVYFSPFSLSHPVVAFRRADLSPRPVGAFDSHYCLVLPQSPAVYVSLTIYEPDFEEKLSRWATVEKWFWDRGANPPRYTVFRAAPKGEVWENKAGMLFGDEVEMRLLEPLPEEVKVGERVQVLLGLQALRPLKRMYSVFVHLYGDPPPWEGGRLWAQGDKWVCESYPSILWREDERVIQEFGFSVPEDAPAGVYQVAVGVYEAPNGGRLPASPGAGGHDFWILQNLKVVR